MKFFIDIEATQFTNEIISFGCIAETGDTFYTLVKPSNMKKVTNLITKITSLAKEELENAPTTDEAFEKFYIWVYDLLNKFNDFETIFYCWGGNDKIFVHKNFRITNTSFKAKSILGIVYASLVDYSREFRLKFNLNRDVKLINAVRRYKGNGYTQTHHSLEDAILLKDLYDAVAASDGENRFPEYEKLLNK